MFLTVPVLITIVPLVSSLASEDSVNGSYIHSSATEGTATNTEYLVLNNTRSRHYVTFLTHWFRYSFVPNIILMLAKLISLKAACFQKLRSFLFNYINYAEQI